MSKPTPQTIVFNWGCQLSPSTAQQICDALNRVADIQFTYSFEYDACTTFTSRIVSLGMARYCELSKFNDGLKTGLLFIS